MQRWILVLAYIDAASPPRQIVKHYTLIARVSGMEKVFRMGQVASTVAGQMASAAC